MQADKGEGGVEEKASEAAVSALSQTEYLSVWKNKLWSHISLKKSYFYKNLTNVLLILF